MKKFFVVSLLIMSFVLTGCVKETDNWDQITAAINIAQGGKVAVLGENAYYIEDQQYVWKSDLEFTKGTKLFSDKYIYLICTDNDAIYYTTSQYDRTPQWEIAKFDLKTKEKTVLATMEKEPELLSCYDKKLLYLRDESIYALNLETKVEGIIVDGAVETFTCATEGLYYATLENSWGGEVYYKQTLESEAKKVCNLPVTIYDDESIDQLFVAQNKIYIRKRSDLDGGWLFTSTSYQVEIPKEGEEVKYISVEDVHAQLPTPNGKGNYYLLASNDDSEKKAFQRHFSNKDSSMTYLASFSAGRLAFSHVDSDWIDEISTDYKYYSSCYFSKKGLILNPSYGDRRVFFGFVE